MLVDLTAAQSPEASLAFAQRQALSCVPTAAKIAKMIVPAESTSLPTGPKRM